VPFFYKDLLTTPIKKYSGAILTGLFGIFADLAVNKAYGMNVTLTTAITGIPFSMIIAFGFSIFAPQLLEKHTLRVYAVRFAAAAVMIVAAIKLSQM
jgi:hypothetical protein